MEFNRLYGRDIPSGVQGFHRKIRELGHDFHGSHGDRFRAGFCAEFLVTKLWVFDHDEFEAHKLRIFEPYNYGYISSRTELEQNTSNW